jgi:hypothetical protein
VHAFLMLHWHTHAHTHTHSYLPTHPPTPLYSNCEFTVAMGPRTHIHKHAHKLRQVSETSSPPDRYNVYI